MALGPHAERCSGAALEPSQENLDRIADAMLCLLNIERETRGLPKLRRNGGWIGLPSALHETW